MTDTTTSIELDHFYPHAPEKVWRVLTTPELIGQWLMQPVGFEPVPGNIFEMTTRPMPGQGFSGRIRCEVLEAVAPELLRITWDDVDSDTPTGWVITWVLRREGTGTRLLFGHSGFDPDSEIVQRARKIMGGGWAAKHERLESVLASVRL
ncbi:SRPBCC family protein [Nocardia brevicatena]|uniref:SRPBCC family protein n=1 Tax=Nocardia brevicatena TaxID=37327 RepID=UPI00031DDCF8|nr:SRPBCC domain-containing protein [Nocardia brevicatena]